MNRREFVAGVTAAGLAGPLTACGDDSAAPATAASTAPALGVQLYTVRDLMAESVEATLSMVADIGYRNVEFAGYYAHAPAAIRRMLDERGLAAPAGHFGEQFLVDDAAAIIDAAATVGHEYFIVPWLPETERNSVDSFRRTAERFNGWGEQCRKAGLKFAYHNHDWEFVDVDGELLFDVLLDETDPELVDFELDLFWIRKAGYSAFEYFERYPGRFKLWHIKDMDADGNMVDVGEGVMDFAAFAAQAEQAGTRFAIVENDAPADPEASIRTGFAAASAIFTV